MRNLDKTWKLCKSMWRWIAEHIDEYEGDVQMAKIAWLGNHGFSGDEWPAEACFFCDYAEREEGRCDSCPGKFVDPKFDCYNWDYRYTIRPKEFYNKIRRMDYARKQVTK